MTLPGANAKRYTNLFLITLLALLAALMLGTQPAGALYDSWPVGNTADDNGRSYAFNPTADGILNYTAPITAAANKSTTISIGTVRNGTTTGGNWSTTAQYRDFRASRLILVIQSTGFPAGTTAECNEPIPNVSCSGGQTPLDLTNHQVGQFEVAKIQSISGSTITLTEKLKNSYAAQGAQVVAIPSFASVTLANNRVISAQSWNGTSGGIVAVMAAGAVTMGTGAQITASELGFRGGGKRNYSGGSQTNCVDFDSTTGNPNGFKGEGIATSNTAKFYSPWTSLPIANSGLVTNSRAMGNRANGAGGGDCENAGGGGGSNAGLGGQGGLSYDAGSEQWPVGGLGGQNLIYDPLDHAVLGGGGGSGDENGNKAGVGGNGGGIVFVRAGSLAASSGSGGKLTANGRSGIAGQAGGGSTGNMNSGTGGSGDGAGGGGGGGVVYARFAGTATCAGVEAKGGAGGIERSNNGVHGPGGGGGGGYIYFQRTTASGSCSENSKAGAPGYVEEGFWKHTSRGAGPAASDPVGNRESDDPSSIGDTIKNPSAIARPTASIGVPAASQVRPITSTISGSATDQSVVDVYIDGVHDGSTISLGGTWAYTTPALTGGAHTVQVVPIHNNIAGDRSPATARTFYVDSYPSNPVTIDSPASDSITNNSTPTIGGFAKNPGPHPAAGDEVGAEVKYYEKVVVGGSTSYVPLAVNGAPIITGSNGRFSATLTDPLDNGDHDIVVTTTDTHENVSGYSNVRKITIDSTPAVVAFTSPPQLSHQKTKRPTFTFTSDKPGTAVCEVVGEVAPVSCTAGTSWQLPATPVLAEGPYVAQVTFTDEAGNETTATRDFTIDTIFPVVAITSPDTDGKLLKSARPQISFSVVDVNKDISECRTLGLTTWSPCDSPYSPPTLADGNYTVEVRHTDRAGNTTAVSRDIVVDTTLPTVVIDQPATSGDYTGPQPTFEFTVTDAHPDKSYCQIDGGVEVLCTSPIAWWGASPLSAGGHNFAVRHVDAAGNVGAAATRNFIVDDTPPVVTITYPTDGALINTTTPQVLFNLVEANPSPTSTCKVDSRPAVPCTSPWVPSPALDQGAHTLTVSHTDRAGNSDAGSTDTVNFTVDSIAPAAPNFTSGPGGAARLTNQTSAELAFTAAESGGHLECWLDDAAVTNPCASPQNFSGLALGEHSFFVRQIDDAGNLGALGVWTWTIDQTPPPPPNVSGPSGVSSAASETFTFYNAQQDVTFTCQLDSGPVVACDSRTYTTGTLAEGNHSFTVWSTDPAGNQSDPTTLNWTTDLNDFGVRITEAPDALSNERDGEILFTTTFPEDSNTSFSCRLAPASAFDSTTATSCSSPFEYTSLPDGEYKFGVLASQSGTPTAEQTRTWTLDATPPVLDVIHPLHGSTTGGAVTLQYDASDPVTTGQPHSVVTRCKLDNAPTITPCADGHVFGNLAAGSHTLKITTTDNAGNSTVVTNTWTVSLTSPVTSFSAKPAAATNSATALFAFAADLSPSTYECSLDGAAWAACASPQTFSVSEGIHTFQVRATSSGNTEPAPASWTWQYNTTPPAAPTIAGDSRVLSDSGDVTLRGSAEVGNTVRLLVQPGGAQLGSDVVAAANTFWDLDLSGLADGEYKVCAKAEDAAGNISDCSNEVTIIVDTDGPTVTISSPDDEDWVTTTLVEFSGSDARTAITYECGIEDLTLGVDIGFTECTTPSYAPDLTNGHRYKVTVRATDEVGLEDTDSVIFTYDAVPPQNLTFETPIDGTHTSDQSPVFSGQVDRDGGTIELEVKLGGTTICTTSVSSGSGSATWSCTPSTPISAGSHTLTVEATDQAGNSSTAGPNSLTIDIDPPADLAFDPALDGTLTNDRRPVIGGSVTLESGSIAIKVFADGGVDPLCSTTVAAGSGTGSWSCQPTGNLAEGSYLLNATATDQAGNTAPGSGDPAVEATIQIDLTKPQNLAISSPENGVRTNNQRPQFSGSVDRGTGSTAIAVKVDGSTVCTASVGAGSGSATWTCTPASDLSSGLHSVEAVATSEAGNVSTAGPNILTVDLVPPPAPTITSPEEGRRLNNQRPQMRGSIDASEAGAQISVFADGSATPLCTATATVTGHWSCEVEAGQALSEGTHTVVATATDRAGNESADASDPVTFHVDLTAPQNLTLEAPADGTRTNDQQPTISGHVDRDGGTTSLTVLIDGQSEPVCSTTVSSGSGSAAWSCTPDEPIVGGEHDISVVALDGAGNSSTTGPNTVTIDLDPPENLAITSPTANERMNEQKPTFTGQVDRNGGTTSVSVHLDGDLDNAICTDVVASGSGSATWSCTPTTEIAPGTHFVQAVAVDEATNSATSAPVTFHIDLTPPQNLTLEQPADGTRTKNKTPTFSGHVDADPGVTEIAVVFDGDTGNPVCTYSVPADAGDEASWQCTPSTDVAEGEYVVTVVATDAAGNSSTAGSVDLTIDLTPPQNLAIDDPTDGETVSSAKPTISGHVDHDGGEITLRVLDGGTVICDGITIAADNGTATWSCTSTLLADGPHTLTAVATDEAGNVATSAQVEITVSGPMTVAITNGPDARTNDLEPTFTFLSNKNATTFQCNLDEAGWQNCTGAESGNAGDVKTYTVTLDESTGQGDHKLEVRGTSGSDQDTDEWTWTVDTAAPVVTISSPAAGIHSNAPRIAVSGTTDEPVVSVDVRDETENDQVCDDVLITDGGTSWACSPDIELSEGPHWLEVRATDDLGNRSEWTRVNFVIDRTPPSVAVWQQAGSGLNGAVPVFLYSVTDTYSPPVAMNCQIDHGPAVPCGPPAWSPAVNPIPGPHTLTVNFIDSAGNAGSTAIGFHATSPPPPPPPPPPPAPDPAECFPQGFAITSLTAKGKRVTLAGFARSNLSGQTAQIFYNNGKKAVARTKVRADGTFKVGFKAPKKKAWNKAKYRVKIGSKTGPRTNLMRRMATTDAWFASGKLRVRGSVTKPLWKKGKATIYLRTDCGGKWKAAKNVTIKRNGKFSTTLDVQAETRVVFVRVRAQVGQGKGKRMKRMNTYSFQIPAAIG